KIWPGMPDDIFTWNKSLLEPDNMTGGGPHPDRAPPRGIDLNGGIGKITGEQQQRIGAAAIVSPSTGAGSAHQQDGPMRSSGTGGEGFVAVDYIAVFGSCGGGSESHFF